MFVIAILLYDSNSNAPHHQFIVSILFIFVSNLSSFSFIKPDESFSDDFLFPMSSTRLSYTSSPESDGEFCEPETPRTLSRNQSYDPNSQSLQQNTQFNSMPQQQKVSRSNSNPSLHREDGTIKSDNGAIPDYNSPPPYAVNLPNSDESKPPLSSSSTAKKRNSQHNMDSKYGFAGSANNGQSNYTPNTNGTQSNNVNESVDELPLPPHPNGAITNGQQQQHNTNVPSSSAGGSNSASRYSIVPQQNGNSKRSQSQPANDVQGKAPELPKVPPKIDRQKKPSRRSATERLFGNGEVSGNYMNSESNSSLANGPTNGSASIPHSQAGSNGVTNRASHHPHSSSSLDRHTHIRDMKMVRIVYPVHRYF